MTSAELLLDTSAALARIDPDHVRHRAVDLVANGSALGLAGYAQFETYSVLTRLPPPKRVDPATASRIIAAEFPHPAQLSATAARRLLEEFAGRGNSGRCGVRRSGGCRRPRGRPPSAQLRRPSRRDLPRGRRPVRGHRLRHLTTWRRRPRS